MNPAREESGQSTKADPNRVEKRGCPVKFLEGSSVGSSNEDLSVKGSCLCGAVRYEVGSPLGTMIHCHCSMCRKHHGTAFATFVGAPLAGYRLTAGANHIAEYPSSPGSHRYFCRICGSTTPTVVKSMDMVFCPAGNLEGDLDVRPSAHYFVGSKAPWYEITDSLPQFVEYPPEFGGGGIQQPERELSEGFVTGSCLCANVAFKAEGSPIRFTNCHCTRCRRGRSAAHASNFFCSVDKFSFVRGEASITDYRVPEAKFFTVAFRNRCGGAAPRISRERGIVVIPAGILDSDPGCAPTSHIFVGSKANWFDITDSLQQHVEMFS